MTEDKQIEGDLPMEEELEREDQGSIVETFRSEDFISKPSLSKKSTLPHNILEFDHSFGYDCQKRFNMCVADENTLLFGSGNVIHIFQVDEKKLKFRRCSTGGGIGHITKNPKYDHIAIGENGIDPPLIIYEWPSLEIVTVLRNGTTRSYSHLRYSPDGEQLVSQGGDPDYLITVWDWKNSKVALQCKSHGQDVYNVIFSATMPGHMTTCGSGHIKCWKMVDTFTGLKLQGELGRFGKTEISDIVGAYPMPDEKVISGCEWGNLLVWNEGLIKIEVCRKNRRPCHESYISQIEYINEELITVGTDGFIYNWFYETMALAEATEDSHFIEVEPIFEYHIGEKSESNELIRRAMIMQMQKRSPNDSNSISWYVQDGNGALWLIDLASVESTSVSPSRKLLSCHAGIVADLATADWAPLAASCGRDGRLRIFDFSKKQFLLEHQFRDRATCLIWLPCDVEPSGSTLICSFETGIIRVVSFSSTDKNGKFVLAQVLKPHQMKIIRMIVNPTYSILITGSEDSTLFVLQIQIVDSYPKLIPIGYVKLPSPMNCMTWKPNNPTTAFVGCLKGECLKIDLPEVPQAYTKTTYDLIECKAIDFKFKSVKSSILREQAKAVLDKKKQEIIRQKMDELAKMKAKNPDLDIDEEEFLDPGMSTEDALPEIYEPEIPSRVCTAMYTSEDTVILSMSGYDCGYMYKYKDFPDEKKFEFVGCERIADVDQEITTYCHLNKGDFVALGLEGGEIMVCKTNPEDELDFSDHWILSMHDNLNGRISALRLSHDGKTLLSCGHDGNIFTYAVDEVASTEKRRKSVTKPNPSIPEIDVPDINYADYPSLEQTIVEAERIRISNKARDEKEEIFEKLRELAEEFDGILKMNEKLPESQRLTDADLELDPRITADLNKHLRDQMDLVLRKLEYKREKAKLRLKKLMDHFVEPLTCLPFAVNKIIEPEEFCWSLREPKLTGDYAIVKKSDDATLEGENAEDQVKTKDTLDSSESKTSDTTRPEKLPIASELYARASTSYADSFFKGLNPEVIEFKLGEEVNLMLKKYRSLKAKLEEHEQEWKVLQSQKPDEKYVNPEDEEQIRQAKNTIGDYKLKASLSLDIKKLPTVESKYKEIVACRQRIHSRRENFNKRLRALYERKLILAEQVDDMTKKLKRIHAEIPEELIKPLPPTFDVLVDLGNPEKRLQMESYTSVAQRVIEKKKRLSTTINFNGDGIDEEYIALLMDERQAHPDSKSLPIMADGNKKKLADDVKATRVTIPTHMLNAIEGGEKADSDLEIEMKQYRAAKKVYEQDQIIRHVEKSYKDFDDSLDELSRERLQIIYESVYMDLYLLTLHQELIVLKKHEGKEKELLNVVEEKQRIKLEIERKLQSLESKINEETTNVTKLREAMRETMVQYLNSVREDRFYLFLKNIVRKKRSKSLKSTDAIALASRGSTTSSTCENSQISNEFKDFLSDDGDISDDSELQKLAQLDESALPIGCDSELYEQAFAVRDSRYQLEWKIKEVSRIIDELKRDANGLSCDSTEVGCELTVETAKLEDFLREKQRQLNDIDITVILKLHQLQHFVEEGAVEKIQDCILFDKTKLSKLYARVGELQQETADLQEKHKNDKQQLRKMKIDCAAMKAELKRLKEQIKKEMEQKFGQQVSLVSLYEAVLRRLIYDIKANTSEIVKSYEAKIHMVKKEYHKQLRILKELVQENTERLSFLTVLEEELLRLRKALKIKIMPESEMEKIESEYKSDLSRLNNALKEQEKQKETLTKDIRSLCIKSKNLIPLEQWLSKTCNDAKPPRPTSTTLIDGKEKESLRVRLKDEQLLDDEDSSSSSSSSNSMMYNEERELIFGDSEYYKRVFAVRQLLSQVATTDETNVKDTIESMLKEISKSMKKCGYSQEEIQHNLNEIMTVSQENEEYSIESDNDNNMESLSDYIYRYSTEHREAAFAQDIEPEAMEIVDKLFHRIGISDETLSMRLSQGLVSRLRMSGDLSAAEEFVLKALPSGTDKDEQSQVSKFVRQSLLEIIKHIEVEGIEWIEMQDDNYQ